MKLKLARTQTHAHNSAQRVETIDIAQEAIMNSGASVSIIKTRVVASKKYTRQEVARIVEVGWACVVEAAKEKKLQGTKETVNNIETWVFTAEQIIAWRSNVDARKVTGGMKQIIVLESTEELAELQALLKGSKFESRL